MIEWRNARVQKHVLDGAGRVGMQLRGITQLEPVYQGRKRRRWCRDVRCSAFDGGKLLRRRQAEVDHDPVGESVGGGLGSEDAEAGIALENESPVWYEDGDAVRPRAGERPLRHPHRAVRRHDVCDREGELVEKVRIGGREMEGDRAGTVVHDDVPRELTPRATEQRPPSGE